MTAERDALSYRPVTIVPESKLSHMASVHYGFVPKLSHHGGKNPRFALKKLFGFASAYGFSCFFLDEKESLKGITVFALRLSECLHTSRLTTNGVNTLTRVSFSARGF